MSKLISYLTLCINFSFDNNNRALYSEPILVYQLWHIKQLELQQVALLDNCSRDLYQSLTKNSF